MRVTPRSGWLTPTHRAGCGYRIQQPRPSQASVPPFDIGDRQLCDRDLGDLVLPDRAHPTLLVACRRRRPRVEVLIDPRVENIDHLAGSGPRSPRPTSNEAARRYASRVPLRTVREICVGRPRASVPVQTRTSHTRQENPRDDSRDSRLSSTRRRSAERQNHSIRRPDIAREMTSCWISDVPSKIVWLTLTGSVSAAQCCPVSLTWAFANRVSE